VVTSDVKLKFINCMYDVQLIRAFVWRMGSHGKQVKVYILKIESRAVYMLLACRCCM